MEAHFTETLEDFMESALVTWVCRRNSNTEQLLHSPRGTQVTPVTLNEDSPLYQRCARAHATVTCVLLVCQICNEMQMDVLFQM